MSPHGLPGLTPQNLGRRSERRRVLGEGGCCSRHDGTCHAAPGPTASERCAGERGKPLAWGGISLWGN